MAFGFNFSGDDIDSTDDNANEHGNGTSGPTESFDAVSAAQVEVKQHDLEQWLSNLPSRISYATTTIESPTGRTLHLPRRELFDIRQQLMAEDDDTTLSDLSNSDIRTNIYEGGFKTWECSVDLSSLLLDRGPRKDIDELARVDNVIELGAGTALPTLTLFQHALQNEYPVAFTLADYNSAVLRLVTLPNLLLTFARFNNERAFIPDDAGDLEVTPDLISAFTDTLSQMGITLHFLSGPWSSDLLRLIPPSSPDMGTLVLAAETIYSPASTIAFVELVTQLLRRTRMAKAVIAAKKVYFGVGGSVDGLKEACNEKGAVAYEVENAGVPGMDQGVGRAIVEVQLY